MHRGLELRCVCCGCDATCDPCCTVTEGRESLSDKAHTGQGEDCGQTIPDSAVCLVTVNCMKTVVSSALHILQYIALHDGSPRLHSLADLRQSRSARSTAVLVICTDMVACHQYWDAQLLLRPPAASKPGRTTQASAQGRVINKACWITATPVVHKLTQHTLLYIDSDVHDHE